METPHRLWGHILCPPRRAHTWQTDLLSPFLSLSGDPSICSISNPDFVIYSSVVSFYLPFGVTVLVYARIYVVLRQRRRKRILTRQNSQCISVRPGFPQQVSTCRGAGKSVPTLWPPSLWPATHTLPVLPHWGHTADIHLVICGVVCSLEVGNPSEKCS